MNFTTVKDLLIIGGSDAVKVVYEGVTSEIADSATPADRPQIRVWNDTTHKGTLPLFGSQILSWKKSSYAAAVAQVTHIGYNTSSGAIEAPVDKQTYTVRFDFTSFWEFCYPKTEIQVEAASTGETASTLADKIVSRVNASGLPITAAKINSGSDYGISLTADDETIQFKVFLVEGFDTDVTDVTYSTAASAAVGSGASIRALEKEVKGYINNNMFPIDLTYDSSTSDNYDIYVIEHLQPVQNAWNRNLGGNPIVTIIAVDTDNVDTAFSAKLEPWLNAAVRMHG